MEGNEDLHEFAKTQRTAAPDDVLALLVDYSNQFDLRAGVRLFLGGGVLSGTLVSGERYFRQLRTDMSEARPRDISDDGARDDVSDSEEETALEAFFRSVENFYAAPEAAGEDSEEQGRVTGFIHVEDASLYLPGQNPLIVGSWRGRLDAVEGWAMGVYSQVTS